MNAASRFMKYVEPVTESGCWIWTGYCNAQSGYGKFTLRRRALQAHRVSYELFKGPIPDGACVLHSCDVRPCVNPAHLRVGSRADNFADMVSRKRQVPPMGERNRGARLSERHVAEIRASMLSNRTVAEIYGITPGHVKKVRNGRLWKHV